MAFNDLNKVLIMGRLTREPELRYTQQGTAVTTLRLASSRSFKTKTGENREETCFVDSVVWGPQAENCGKYLVKGQRVLVEGRLASRSFETKDGQKRSVIEIRAESVQFMEKPRGAAESGGERENAPAAEEEWDPFAGGGEDNDIPF